jgi:hypothetical protein
VVVVVTSQRRCRSEKWVRQLGWLRILCVLDLQQLRTFRSRNEEFMARYLRAAEACLFGSTSEHIQAVNTSKRRGKGSLKWALSPVAARRPAFNAAQPPEKSLRPRPPITKESRLHPLCMVIHQDGWCSLSGGSMMLAASKREVRPVACPIVVA